MVGREMVYEHTFADSSDCLVDSAEVKCSMTDDTVIELVPVDVTLTINSSIYCKKLWAVCSAELDPGSMRGTTGCSTNTVL